VVHGPILGDDRTQAGTGSRRDPPCLRDMTLALVVAVLCVSVALDGRAGPEVVQQALPGGLCGGSCVAAVEGEPRSRDARAFAQPYGWRLASFWALTRSRTVLCRQPDRNDCVALPSLLLLRLRRLLRQSPSTPPDWRSRE